AAVLSFLSLFIWLGSYWPESSHRHHDAAHHHDEPHARWRSPLSIQITPVSYLADPATDASADAAHESSAHSHTSGEKIPPHLTGTYYTLGRFGPLEFTISYYIDSLTIAMFCMVTLIASCIHFYAIG